MENSKTYVVRIKVDNNDTEYSKIEQALYDLDIADVDLLEVYED